MNRQYLEVSIVLEGGQLPDKATEGSAAYDLYTSDNFVLKKGRNLVPLGIRLQFPQDWEVLIDARSGFSVKGFEVYDLEDKKFENPIRIDADVIQGKGDSDYTGIYHVIVKSNEDREYIVKKGTRIAQMTFVPVGSVLYTIRESLRSTERGNGGFEHSGTGMIVGGSRRGSRQTWWQKIMTGIRKVFVGRLFVLLCVFSPLVCSCSKNQERPLIAVLSCGDSVFISAYALTAQDGEVWFKCEQGTGYIADVEYIIPQE